MDFLVHLSGCVTKLPQLTSVQVEHKVMYLNSAPLQQQYQLV